MTNPGCKDCEFRHFGCHANCEIYNDWLAQLREEKKATRDTNLALNSMWCYGGKNGRKK